MVAQAATNASDMAMFNNKKVSAASARPAWRAMSRSLAMNTQWPAPPERGRDLARERQHHDAKLLPAARHGAFQGLVPDCRPTM